MNYFILISQPTEATSTSITYPLGFKTEPDILSSTVSTPPKTPISTTNATETKPLMLGLR